MRQKKRKTMEKETRHHMISTVTIHLLCEGKMQFWKKDTGKTKQITNWSVSSFKGKLKLFRFKIVKYQTRNWLKPIPILFISLTANNRRFHGRGRHLGAYAAKFTVNVWEKSWLWCSITRGRLIFWISVNCTLKILAERVNRSNLKSIGLPRSEKSSF